MSLSSVTASSSNFSSATVYTARDFSGFTIQHLKAMYPTRWQEAALHYGLAEPDVHFLRQTALQQQVWDFFPTPKTVVTLMLQVAQLRPEHSVLEPSAGSGDLAQAIANLGVKKIDCFELHPLLQQALRLQGFPLLGADFLASQPQPIYDSVIANPPFSNNGVARHTQHAFQFLKPGGKLITLAHHYRLKPSRTDLQFFDWLTSVHARFLNLGRAFEHSDRPTQTPLQLIAIKHP